MVSWVTLTIYMSTNVNSIHQTPLGSVAQWVARLTRDRWIPVSREFKPHHMPLLFP